MVNFKLVVSDPKSKKAYQKEVEQKASGLLGKKIGERLKADSLGLPGYELEITGGSDTDGFPMRRDVEGPARKRVLLSSGPGFHPSRKGLRKRKSVRGNTISPSVSQINTKIVSHGSRPVQELLGAPKAKEEKAPEAKAKEVKPKEEGLEDKIAREKAELEKQQEKKEEPKKKEVKEEKAAPEEKGKPKEKPKEEAAKKG